MNPFLEAEQQLAGRGKHPVGVTFDSLFQPACITFHCSDGSDHEVKITATHAKFMEWWKQLVKHTQIKLDELN